MNLSREEIVNQMDGFGRDASRRARRAVEVILGLAAAYLSRWGERFDEFPELDEKVNEVLRGMSDSLLSDMRRRAVSLLEILDYDEDEEILAEIEEKDRDGKGILFRLDLHASHLKELIEKWLTIVAAGFATLAVAKKAILSFWGNAHLSPHWTGDPLHWGMGMDRKIPDAISVVGQDYIGKAAVLGQLAAWSGDDRIVGYMVERGSSYHCPACDSNLGRVFPLDVAVLPVHPRCVCYMVPVVRDSNK